MGLPKEKVRHWSPKILPAKFNSARLLLAVFLIFSGCKSVASNAKALVPDHEAPFDISMLATVLSVKELKEGSVSDAVFGKPEETFDTPSALVVFKVERMIDGEFALREGGPNQTEQLGQAFKDRNPLAVFNLQDPNLKTQKDILSVAAADPRQFELSSWSELQNRRFKLFLKRDKLRDHTYYLVKVKK